MATGYVAPLGKFIAFDSITGKPLANGKVWTYQAGLSTQVLTWSDQALTVPNQNPVILDPAGRANIWIADASVMTYKFVVQDKNGVEQYTADGISIPAPPASSGGGGGGGGTTTSTGAVPPGGIVPYGGASAPAGTETDGRQSWLLCDGQSYSAATYAALFSAIGIQFGQTGGAGNFNVPDGRGRFLLGVSVTGVGSTRGEKGGALDHSHSVPLHQHAVPDHLHAMPHTHNVPAAPWPVAGQEFSPTPGTLVATQSGYPYADTARAPGINTGASSNVNTSNMTGLVTGNQTVTGLVTGNANPAYLAINFIIKT